MMFLKTDREIDKIRRAGGIAANALALAGEAVVPGVSTAIIDKIVKDYIERNGAIPSFLGYNGYPASACVSINNEVIHGIPSPKRIVKQGDIVSIDIGAYLDGYHSDNAATFAAGEVSNVADKLLKTTKECLQRGINAAQPGGRLGDIGAAVEQYAESMGFSVVRQYVGHGVGRDLHESPDVPNFGLLGRGIRLVPGMTIAIEPMINAGRPGVEVLQDNWTVITTDGKLSAHFEHTIAITANGPLILTLP
jgi:methionyl aminopeptidase